MKREREITLKFSMNANKELLLFALYFANRALFVMLPKCERERESEREMLRSCQMINEFLSLFSIFKSLIEKSLDCMLKERSYTLLLKSLFFAFTLNFAFAMFVWCTEKAAANILILVK
jgi:hypothetical protein